MFYKVYLSARDMVFVVVVVKNRILSSDPSSDMGYDIFLSRDLNKDKNYCSVT